MAGSQRASRLHPRELLHTGSVGLRTRPARSMLSALGIAIGIASMMSVVGISESSRADLLADLDRLGTNLLTVAPGKTLTGDSARMPQDAPGMIRRIGPVQSVSATYALPDEHPDGKVYRSEHVPHLETGGMSVAAAAPDLLDTLSGDLHSGQFLNDANIAHPVVVLGHRAAGVLGVTDTSGAVSIVLGDQRFTVIGILDPLVLAPELDRRVLVGLPAAQVAFGITASPTEVYVRAVPEHVGAVRSVLAATASPAAPQEVSVSRPSDALAARAAATSAFTALLLGLGSVALVVGGVGIANVMIISVLERRSEIGLRRALGATRRHVRAQFLSEALLLSAGGGAAGIAAGIAVVAGYAAVQGLEQVVPLAAVAAGLVVSVAIGGVAGLYPAARAARLAPAEALRST